MVGRLMVGRRQSRLGLMGELVIGIETFAQQLVGGLGNNPDVQLCGRGTEPQS